eukprot:TRINITY_DN106645_c0_g1_i1.p1 TRINITY_DN106645_c0_g1~~TRINITY_DN106645_c0_g1_i1.p1  ORF type:complete len:1091 (-),score=174.04 TRINITY_DN106645_c0_g1_i1:321-3593(-)
MAVTNMCPDWRTRPTILSDTKLVVTIVVGAFVWFWGSWQLSALDVAFGEARAPSPEIPGRLQDVSCSPERDVPRGLVHLSCLVQLQGEVASARFPGFEDLLPPGVGEKVAWARLRIQARGADGSWENRDSAGQLTASMRVTSRVQLGPFTLSKELIERIPNTELQAPDSRVFGRLRSKQRAQADTSIYNASTMTYDEHCQCLVAGDTRVFIEFADAAMISVLGESKTDSDVLECHNTQPGDLCYTEIHWAKSQGIQMHPEWYPGLHAGSSDVEFQVVIHRETGKCPMPCPLEAPPQQTKHECYDAKLGEMCYGEITWAKSDGIRKHPEWYPGLTAASSNSAFQAVVHANSPKKCPQPCTGKQARLEMWKDPEGSKPSFGIVRAGELSAKAMVQGAACSQQHPCDELPASSPRMAVCIWATWCILGAWCFFWPSTALSCASEACCKVPDRQDPHCEMDVEYGCWSFGVACLIGIVSAVTTFAVGLLQNWSGPLFVFMLPLVLSAPLLFWMWKGCVQEADDDAQTNPAANASAFAAAAAASGGPRYQRLQGDDQPLLQAPSRPTSSASEASKGGSTVVKHVFFDFDQTISRIHVFKQLAGWEPGVSAPRSQSERGQIHRLRMLNTDRGRKYRYSESTNSVTECIPGGVGSGSWTSAALGGVQRVQELRTFFSTLQASGVKMTIITKGNVGACQYLLEHDQLLQFFGNVFGMIGATYGESEFDKAHQEPSRYEGRAENELRDSKANLILNLMALEGLDGCEAVLVEDDSAEISSVAQVCRSVYVSERKGMNTWEMNKILELAGLAPSTPERSSNQATTAQAARPVRSPLQASSATGSQKQPSLQQQMKPQQKQALHQQQQPQLQEQPKLPKAQVQALGQQQAVFVQGRSGANQNNVAKTSSARVPSAEVVKPATIREGQASIESSDVQTLAIAKDAAKPEACRLDFAQILRSPPPECWAAIYAKFPQASNGRDTLRQADTATSPKTTTKLLEEQRIETPTADVEKVRSWPHVSEILKSCPREYWVKLHLDFAEQLSPNTLQETGVGSPAVKGNDTSNQSGKIERTWPDICETLKSCPPDYWVALHEKFTQDLA